MSTTHLPFTNDQVLRRRAEICEQNAAQPRCAGCGNDLVDRDGKCAISAVFVCGDLLCFWCWHNLFHEWDETGGWQWGNA